MESLVKALQELGNAFKKAADAAKESTQNGMKLFSVMHPDIFDFMNDPESIERQIRKNRHRRRYLRTMARMRGEM